MPHDFEAWWAGLGPEGDEWPKKALAAAAHGTGLAAERARIRKELLESIGAIKIASDNGTDILCVSTLTAALDRICPEGKE